MSDLLTYLLAVCSNWFVIVTTTSPFALDEFLKRVSPKFRPWFEKTVSAKTRRKWEVAIMSLGFLVANFMAFESEHTACEQAEIKNASLTLQLNKQSPSAQSEEVKTLKTEMEEQKIEFKRFKASAITDGTENGWPALTDNQISEWAQALAPSKLTSIEFGWGSHGLDGRNLYQSIQKLGEKLNCKVTTREEWSDDNRIEIDTVPNDPAAPILEKLFKSLQSGVKMNPLNPPSLKTSEVIISLPQIQEIPPPSSTPPH